MFRGYAAVYTSSEKTEVCKYETFCQIPAQ